MRQALQPAIAETPRPVVELRGGRESVRARGDAVPDRLRDEVAELLRFLGAVDSEAPSAYESLETRLDSLDRLTRRIEMDGRHTPDELRKLQEWFRTQTDAVFASSRLMRRVREWPEGYPGDYATLEAVYANETRSVGIGRLLDRYLLSRTLAVAVRSRLRKLSSLLTERAKQETGHGRWLNVACGSCRELLHLSTPTSDRTLHLIDSDPNALAYAEALVKDARVGATEFVAENALRLVNARRNRNRFGELTTIYSAGLFDYIRSESLAALLRGLYDSLAPGGMLIAPFKDAERYSTFDYHWVAKWSAFFQRTVPEFRGIFDAAGIPREAIEEQRDDTGVIVFFIVRK